MRNLLSANLARLRKDLLFWLGIAAMTVYAVIMLVSWNRTNQIILQSERPEMAMGMEQFLFSFAGLIGVLLAAFTGLFLGTEYSDGVLRSKLIVGHSRSAVYLSNLFSSVIASFLMCLTYIAVMLAVGIPVYGPLTAEPLALLSRLAEVLAVCMAHCALFTLITMNRGNKALSAVACVLGVLALMWMTSSMLNHLTEPEFRTAMVFDETLQEWVESGLRPNPNYVSGPLRVVFRFFCDVLPTGQGMQLASTNVGDHSSLLPLYSLTVTAVSTGFGLLLFRRKDLK